MGEKPKDHEAMETENGGEIGSSISGTFETILHHEHPEMSNWYLQLRLDKKG